MTAEPLRPGQARPEQRPTLAVITSCGECGTPTIKVQDRDGRPVVFDAGPDGKAARDPYGTWWLAKIGPRWTVVLPAPGEDPPTSGGGVRLREHDCLGEEVSLLKAVFGAEVISTIEAPVPKPGDQVLADGFERPPGRGRGLDGPACREREFLPQETGGGHPQFQATCVRCGRVTNRRDQDGMSWCGGGLPDPRHGPPWWPGRDDGIRTPDTV